MAHRLKKLAVALGLAGLCTVANAAPAVAAVAAAWTATAVTVAGVAITWGAIIKTALIVGYGMKQRQKAKREARRQRDAYNASLQDRNVMVAEASPEVKHIYGRATVGGAVAAIFTRGNKDQYKDVVIMWAGHECDGIEDVFISGESLQLDAEGNATAPKWSSTVNSTTSVARTFSATGALALPGDFQKMVSIAYSANDSSDILSSGLYTITGGVLQLKPEALPVWANLSVSVSYQRQNTTSHVRMRHHLGAPGQLADGQLITDTAGLAGAWTAADRLSGICYSVVTLDLNNTELQGGLPQITVKLRGKKVLDPRSGATAWSDNPALCVHDFLRAADYGKGVLVDQIEGVIAAANACDELITVETSEGPVTAPRYTCNGAWSSSEDPDNVLDDLCGAMSGYAVPGGVWRVQAGVYSMPVMVLGDDQAAGAISMVPAPSRADAWNGVKGQYIDPGQYNQAVDFEPLQSAAYVEDDGGEVWGAANFPFTDAGWRARTLAAISMEKSRAKQLVWRGTLACLRVQVGDRVVVNNDLLGLSGATFRVTKRAYDHASAAVELSLEQDQPSYYASVSNAQQQGPGVQPDDTYRVKAPTGLVLSSPAPGRILLQLDASRDLRVTNGGALLIQVSVAGSNAWVSAPSAPGDATEQAITVLQKGIYIVQVDWRASTGQQSGQWLAGSVAVTETAYATPGDLSDAVAGAAQQENPVFTGVVGLPLYPLGALPVANGDHQRKAILVIDSLNRPAVCVSDNTNWISQITGSPVA